MIRIVEEAIVSCYVDAASLLLMIMLLLLSSQISWEQNAAMRVFRMISWCVAVNCAMCFITNAMYMQTAPWCHTVVLIARLLRELLVLAVNVLWGLYVYHKLYGEEIRHRTALALASLPFAVLFFLHIINLFTGILYTYSPENQFEPRPLLYLSYIFGVLYFTASALLVWFYDRKSKKIRFFHVAPMILPIMLAISVQFFLPYDIGILGYAIGVTMLQFTIIGEYRFLDGGSGLYNNGYLAYLFDLAAAGKYEARSALILEAGGNLPACFEILRSTLHKEGDVIRTEENRFLMFSGESSRSAVQYQVYVLDGAVSRYNAAHPDASAQLTARCRMRTDDEDVFSFLRTATEQEEVGDEMRGIVSMISELDRLDEELKLASDIQINMLPRIFPPFPERREFDLYALMNPAKEVGGDFYDFFMVDSDHLAMVIADVSGKGIPASLFMMVSKTLIKNQLMTGLSPAEALSSVTLQLCDRNEAQMFVTVWAAVLELSTGKGLACNAGHEHPVRRQAGGSYELVIYRHNMSLGVFKAVRYTDRSFELKPGDSLFVYTDGVPEANNPAGEMFGTNRLLDALNLEPDAGPKVLLSNVRKAVDEFAENTPQFDDLTMLSLKYYGLPAESD